MPATGMAAMKKICHSSKMSAPCSVAPRGMPKDPEQAVPSRASAAGATWRPAARPPHGLPSCPPHVRSGSSRARRTGGWTRSPRSLPPRSAGTDPRRRRQRMPGPVAQISADPVRDQPGHDRHQEQRPPKDRVERVHLDAQELRDDVVSSGQHQHDEEGHPGGPEPASHRGLPGMLREVVPLVIPAHPGLQERPEREDREDQPGNHEARQEHLADRVAEDVELPVRPQAEQPLQPPDVVVGL